MSKIFITTAPFGDASRIPFDRLAEAGLSYKLNPFDRKLTEKELTELVGDAVVLIAGTERITDSLMAKAGRLRLISRVGVGLDSVDLLAAKKRGIAVSYTPDAPAPAVAELTLALMLSLLRFVNLSNIRMHRGEWHRFFGRRVSEVTFGLIGAGRIGRRVLGGLVGLGARRILVNDIRSNLSLPAGQNAQWASKELIYKEADVVSIHTPLTSETRHMICRKQLLSMKADANIINTARGGIVNETDLFEVLQSGHLNGAAIDVFNQEPYDGPLAQTERCLLTSHMGSMSIDCRSRMEIEATEEAIRFLTGRPLQSLVPPHEYDMQGLRS